jgi:pimeloyl-ACP methyl ester carboxylesterase
MTKVPLPAQETVVLLHGLARTAASMQPMADALESEDYQVLNLDYDSRHHSIETLADDVRRRIIEATQDATKIHFVTHSMGGILVRQIQATDPISKLGRVVMLSPPNQGSEVVDRIGDWRIFKSINGPAGQQLGTAEDSFVNQLGPVPFDCGIITGDRSINWINSGMIPGPDDGKVSVARARVAGMSAFKVVHATHPMIMKKKSVIKNTLRYLNSGSFDDPEKMSGTVNFVN